MSSLLSNSNVFTDVVWDLGGLVDEKPDYWVGIDSRGFIFSSALGNHFNCGIKLIRKKGKLPPPVISEEYELEYGTDTLEMKPGKGAQMVRSAGGYARIMASDSGMVSLKLPSGEM